MENYLKNDRTSFECNSMESEQLSQLVMRCSTGLDGVTYLLVLLADVNRLRLCNVGTSYPAVRDGECQAPDHSYSTGW